MLSNFPEVTHLVHIMGAKTQISLPNRPCYPMISLKSIWGYLLCNEVEKNNYRSYKLIIFKNEHWVLVIRKKKVWICGDHFLCSYI